ncbi:ShlB/FhaC/HecB family hemolysin secretion/activation protein [Pseudomonas sp. NY15437]|uniref:ShlB/FhaC/HecB family hemolysin secretion/activation protein n=1 Tax=Pseudomonas sp. NY15437 TaxID=3400360 RepID=UPI003A89A525
MQLKGERSKPWRVSASRDNNGDSTSGEQQAGVGLDWDSPLGLADQFGLRYGQDVVSDHWKHSDNQSLWYSVPYGWWTFNYSYSRNYYRTRNEDAGFAFKYDGDNETHQLGAQRVLFRDDVSKTGVSFGLSHQRTRNYVDDTLLDVSSDYLLGLLGYDPDQSQKRLGDGLYEQRLIRDAIVARTGQRYIAGITDDENLFKYLMDNAIAYKDSLHLSLGVGLTAEQVAALTHDIVWLEEATVNGEKVLVPVLYLAQADGRLAPNGALIMGKDVSLISGGDLSNQGTLRASGDLSATAANLSNTGLIEAAGRLDLLALDSIKNSQGGVIAGRDVSLTALTGDVLNERSVAVHDGGVGKRTWTQSFADSAARIEAAGNLDISAGRDISNLGGSLNSGGDLSMQAGRDINLTSVELENGRTNGRNYNQSTTQLGGDISAGRDISLDAGRDVSAIASRIDAGRDIGINAGRDVVLASAADEQHRYDKSKKVTRQQDHIDQRSTEITAGGDALIAAGQDLTLISSKITAGNEAYLVAGDKIQVLAANDSDYSLYDKKSKGSWGKKKTQRDEVTDVKAMGSEISAGGDITLLSGGGQKYQAAKLDSGNDIAIVSGGEVDFEAVKDLHQEGHQKNNSDLAWSSSKGKGNTDETVRQTQMIAHGDVVIKAVDGLSIDYKHLDKKSVSQAIDAMVKADPNLAWIKDAEARGDVNWQAVKELHDSYSYSHSGMGQGTMLAVAIVATVLTYGAASTAIGAGAASSTALSAGTAATATSAATAAGWANVALSMGAASLASTGAVSTINNKGDIGQGLKDTFSGDSLKQALVASVVAGFMAAYGPEWFGGKTDPATNTTTSTAGQGAVGAIPDVTNPANWSRFAGMQLTQGALTGAANEALGQGNFGDAMQGALYSIMQASAFKYVGDLGLTGSSLQNTAAHALAGGLLAEAMGSDFRTGAIAAGASEAMADTLQSGFLSGTDEQAKRLQQAAAQMVGILAAAGVNGDVQVGGDIAKSGMAYNRQLHPAERELAKNLAEKSGGKYTVEQIEEQLRFSNINGTDVGPATDMLSKPGELIYDVGGKWLKVGDDVYLQQFAKLDLDVVAYIQSSTSDYNWSAFPMAPSPDWSKTPSAGKEMRDRLTGYVLDETGRYTVPVAVEGVVYSPKFLPCASSECIATGANLDFSNIETLRYLRAADTKSLNDLSKILAVGAIVTSGGTATALGAASNIPSLMAGYLKGDLSGAMSSAALSAGFESYASARGLSPDIAGKLANILTVMGTWDGVVENGRDLFK